LRPASPGRQDAFDVDSDSEDVAAGLRLTLSATSLGPNLLTSDEDTPDVKRRVNVNNNSVDVRDQHAAPSNGSMLRAARHGSFDASGSVNDSFRDRNSGIDYDVATTPLRKRHSGSSFSEESPIQNSGQCGGSQQNGGHCVAKQNGGHSGSPNGAAFAPNMCVSAAGKETLGRRTSTSLADAFLEQLPEVQSYADGMASV